MNELEVLIGRNPAVCYTQIKDEIIILSPIDENFYHLNESAVDLWLSLDAPKTISELAQILVKKYTELPETYQQDVIEWIEENKQKGLLVAVGSDLIS